MVAVVIARLLTPEEYGLAALAIIFSSLVMVFSDLALGAALIQRKTLSEEDRNTAFWVDGRQRHRLHRGSVCSWRGRSRRSTGSRTRSRSCRALGVASSSPPSARPQLTLMMRVMDFRRSELLGLAGSRRRRVCGVVLAARGAGAWALVMQQIAATVLTTALVWCGSTGIRASCSRWRAFATSAGSASTCSASGSLLPAGERRSLPDRPLSRHHRAGYLRRGLQHHAGAGEQGRGPAPARVLARFLAAPGRA